MRRSLTLIWLIDFLLEAQQAKNAYLQGIPNTNIKGDYIEKKKGQVALY